MSEDEFLDEGEEYIVDIYADIERNLRSYSGFDSLFRELIQNSDDSANGQNVNVDILFNEDALVLKNNTVFTDRDWEHIKKIGSRNKESDSERAGRFGIGFTSVFKICDTLNIHSKGASKKADLSKINTSKKWRAYTKPKYSENNTTEFEFFWRTEDSNVRTLINGDIVTPKKKEEYLNGVIKCIDNDLHFLKNITRIRIYEREKLLKSIEIDRKSLVIGYVNLWKEVKTITINNNISTVYLYHYKLENEFSEEYATGIARNSSILLSIAFDCSNFENGRIFCTLPTEMCTGSPLNINSDFQPDPNRRQIITKTDDEKGLYNLKIFEYLPNLLDSIIDDLKNTLTVESFYTLLNSFLNNETIVSSYFQDFVDVLINSDPDVIFINNEWHCINDVKFSRNSTIIPFLERIEYPIIPEEHSIYHDLFEKLGVKEFELEDLISLIEENIPEKTLFKESIFESKDELISIFNYLENLDRDTLEENKETIKRINIFLTNNSKLINFSIGKITRYPKELESLKGDLTFSKIDDELFHIFKELLERLDIFTVTSPRDIIELLSSDFEAQTFPLDLINSKPYLNTKEKLVTIITFLDPFLKIIACLKTNQPISTDLINKFGNKSFEEGFIRPHTRQYRDCELYFEKYLERTKYLPLSLSEEGSLYSLENNKVFNLISQLEKDFASRYQLVTIDPDIASMLKSFGFVQELDLVSIFFNVKQECESGIALEQNFLLLLYQLMVDKKNQLIDNSKLKYLIENLPIFIDNKGNTCSLKNEQKEIFLQGSFDDYTGIARILDNEMIDSVDEFKKSILRDHFKIKTLDFKLFVENYLEDIFNESDVDTDKKLELIKDLSTTTLESEKVGKILKNTKFIYCNDQEFHYPYERDIFYLNPKEKEVFASKNDLLIMDPNVKIIVSKYNLIKKLELDHIFYYTEAGLNKGSILNDSDIVLLYKLIFDDSSSLSNKELKSRIRRLPIFKNTQGKPCTLENNGKEMMLLGDYRDPIGINEILSNDLIDKVDNFKKVVLTEYLGIKTLDFKLFVERYFPEIFNDESIEKSKKLELLKELNKKFLNLNDDPNFDINILRRIKLVYCQDGNFYFPSHENLYFKNELIDEIFEDDYLFPCLEDFEDYRRMYEILEIKSQLSPREIIDYVKQKISLEEIDLNLINKMRTIFVYINDHWGSFEDFSELAEIKWLPATDDSKTLYNPSSLFTQSKVSKAQNTRQYLIYLDNIRYLDVTDKQIIKAELVNVLKLKNVHRIPTGLIIDNIEQANKKHKPLKNYLEIYSEINRRIDNKSYNSWAQDINRLNDFPSIYIKYQNEDEFSFFEPCRTFKNDSTVELYGNEYIGYLTRKFVVDCEKLINYLHILEAPDCRTIKGIFKNINDKYEKDNYLISSEKDKNIVINCLKELNKNIDDCNFGSDLISELQTLHILYNNENVLLKPNMAILEDNPSLADQFRGELGTYFVKYNTDYLNLINRLEIKRLSRLVEKDLEFKPDVSSLEINEDYTYKVRWISELLPRIKIENEHLEDEWAEICPEIKVYQFDDLSVLKYVVWDGTKHNSCANEINCYIEMNGNVFSEIYVKESNEEILESLAEEIFEDIHPNISKDFKSVIYTLLTKSSPNGMDEYLTFLNYTQVEKSDDTLLQVDKKIDDNISDESEELLDEGNHESDDYYTDSRKDIGNDECIEANDTKEILTSKTEEKLAKNEVFNSVNTSTASINNTFDEDTISKHSPQKNKITDYNGSTSLTDESSINFKNQQNDKINTNSNDGADFGKEKVNKRPVKLDHVDISNRKIPDSSRSEQIGKQHKQNKTKSPQEQDDEYSEVKKGKTTSPSMGTNFKEKIIENNSSSPTGGKNNNGAIEEKEEPLPLEETQQIKRKAKERFKKCIRRERSNNIRRSTSERLDPNEQDKDAVNEIKEWYKGRCQICGRTFREKNGMRNFCVVTKLDEIRNQGISDISNMVCLCSYHAAIFKHGFKDIDLDNVKKNEVIVKVYDEYNEKKESYENTEYVIKYKQRHFLEFQSLLEWNNEKVQ
ncbi:hypothetical protein EO98_17630 [Methanosarcina sp. 2.H.T.1A.6]|uniref:sacsin N-terminal ATP-binding-like domain-containing protein n=1 Tax=unclassified Methanosarcina TaxID=2644672 RepID=UPI000620F327|nr:MULTISPECIES: hypothetical protein [unclassified Methanosarcina]KKG14642.1 hypothetical protein EO94_01620 [Methanosarcina sp. 2.H.T.1A.3]KKG24570.1 hypothetical protein EO98_17630 [Methanosarcina sp. 2.H.T.1A.6]KKG25829.1 hypothetical protein EO96_19590 [Methanosarcina sp. 2.H.T.1A.8]KKG26627.1 hypothetical protein EO97_15755 [Methanosarcina sp. 2.H.T.1A.15]